MALRFFGLCAALVAGLSNAQALDSTFSPARPPAIPLAVKNPYMQTWLFDGSDGGNGGYLAGRWPQFWQNQVVGWTGLIRVDGVSYTWMGDPVDPSGAALPNVTQTAFEYTSTRSIFTQNVNGTVGLTVTFLSNLTPNDLFRQSIIASYLQVEVTSLDGQDHDVQLYTDITGEWVSGDRSAVIEWDYDVIADGSTAAPSVYPTTTTISAQPTVSSQPERFVTYATRTSYSGWRTARSHTFSDIPPHHHRSARSATAASDTSTTGSATISSVSATATGNTTATSATSASSTAVETNGIAYHQIHRQTQLAFSEIDQQTEYGNWYYFTANTTNLAFQSGEDSIVRGSFISNGTILDTQDTNYRAINDSYPVFAFSLDLGTIGADSNSTSLFGISLNQEEAIQFEGAQGNVSVPSLWTSYFSNDLDEIAFFYNDHSNQDTLATTFDDMVASDSAAAGGDNYTTITSLSARQAFGAVQLTGTPNTTYLFLKEISSDGNIQTVDVLFPFHPILIYTNPTLLKLALDPLFENQEAGYWDFAYTIHDLGASYPNATGHNGPDADQTTEMQPLEECGNIIIMALAYAQRTNDNAWLASHYSILRQWNEYLVEEALIPANQISTDDFAGSLANQTNLAIKGIIGIEAMAQIANRTGNTADGVNYTNIAHSYVTQWQTLGTDTTATPPHTELNYGNTSTYSLLYNIFSDRELGLELVPQSVYDMQSTFYPTVLDEYGVPLDTRHTYTKLDWEIFCASVASDSTKALFIDAIANWINVTPTDMPLTDLYDAISGDYPAGIFFAARPVVGGNFAILALNGAPTSGYVTPGT